MKAKAAILISIFSSCLAQEIVTSTIYKFNTSCTAIVVTSDKQYFGCADSNNLNLINLIETATTGVIIKQTSMGDPLKSSMVSEIFVTPKGEIYLLGITYGTWDGLPRVSVTTLYDLFLMKISPTGITEWTRLFGSTANDYGYNIHYTPDEDCVYLAHYCGGSVFGNAFAGPPADNCYSKWASNGTLIWFKEYGTAAHEVTFAVDRGKYASEIVISGAYRTATNPSIWQGFVARVRGGDGFFLMESSRPQQNLLQVRGIVYVSELGCIYAVEGDDVSSSFIARIDYDTLQTVWANVVPYPNLSMLEEVIYDPVTLRGYAGGSYVRSPSLRNSAVVVFDRDGQVVKIYTDTDVQYARIVRGSNLGDRARFLITGQNVKVIDVVFGKTVSTTTKLQISTYSSISVAKTVATFPSALQNSISTTNPISSLIQSSTAPVSSMAISSVLGSLIAGGSAWTSIELSSISEELSNSLQSQTDSSLPVSTETYSDGFSTSVNETLSVANPVNLGNDIFHSNFTFYLISGLSVFILMLIVSLIVICRRRKSDTTLILTKTNFSSQTNVLSDLDPTVTTTTTTTTFAQTNNSLGSLTSTLVPTQQGLSLPGYLKVQEDKHFVKDKYLTSGGGGEIYLAKPIDKSLQEHGKRIILKVPKLDPKDYQAKKHVQQEIAVMSFLRGKESIATLVGYTDDLCILMKYYSNGSLSRFIADKEQVIAKRMLIRFVSNVGSGLQYMHTYGLVHCDIKPANVLLDFDKTGELVCVITDFGITRILNSSLITVKDMRVTNLKGISYNYAAPEQFMELGHKLADHVHISSQVVPFRDIYSLSMIFVALANRKEPWKYNDGI